MLFKAAKQGYDEGGEGLIEYATKGHPDAQYYLAWLHMNGFLGKVDDYAARCWLTKAAEQGYPKAQLTLAILNELTGQ